MPQLPPGLSSSTAAPRRHSTPVYMQSKDQAHDHTARLTIHSSQPREGTKHSSFLFDHASTGAKTSPGEKAGEQFGTNAHQNKHLFNKSISCNFAAGEFLLPPLCLPNSLFICSPITFISLYNSHHSHASSLVTRSTHFLANSWS